MGEQSSTRTLQAQAIAWTFLSATGTGFIIVFVAFCLGLRGTPDLINYESLHNTGMSAEDFYKAHWNDDAYWGYNWKENMAIIFLGAGIAGLSTGSMAYAILQRYEQVVISGALAVTAALGYWAITAALLYQFLNNPWDNDIHKKFYQETYLKNIFGITAGLSAILTVPATVFGAWWGNRAFWYVKNKKDG